MNNNSNSINISSTNEIMYVILCFNQLIGDINTLIGQMSKFIKTIIMQ